MEGNLSQVRFNLGIVVGAVAASAGRAVWDMRTAAPSLASGVSITLVHHSLGDGRRGRGCP